MVVPRPALKLFPLFYLLQMPLQVASRYSTQQAHLVAPEHCLHFFALLPTPIWHELMADIDPHAAPGTFRTTHSRRPEPVVYLWAAPSHSIISSQPTPSLFFFLIHRCVALRVIFVLVEKLSTITRVVHDSRAPVFSWTLSQHVVNLESTVNLGLLFAVHIFVIRSDYSNSIALEQLVQLRIIRFSFELPWGHALDIVLHVSFLTRFMDKTN